MTEVTIATVKEFHDAVKVNWPIHAVYRGENSTSYDLVSRWGRFERDNSKNNSGYERLVLSEFKKRAVPFLTQTPNSDLEWLGLAQHHGLPTRLLDWTENPLIAAYFATLGRSLEDSIIYVVDRFKIEEADEAVSPFASGKSTLYRPRHSNARFVAQRGVFILHDPPTMPFDTPSLAKWTLKSNCLPELRATAKIYGVSAATMFPDLAGVCTDMVENYIWSKEWAAPTPPAPPPPPPPPVVGAS
jgi:hypothetical protein